MSVEQRSSPPSSVDRPARAPDSFTGLVANVRTRVDERLGPWLAPRVAAATAISPEVGAAAEAVRDLALRGGKRLRAALVVAGFAARSTAGSADSLDWSVCEPAMLAIELLQTYLLIHDDWMDGDDVRRGGPAVHVLLRERLGRDLGDAGAILAGDLASGYAQEALLETKLPPERVLRAARAFARIQIDVVNGQTAEMTAARSARPASVENVYALKTASYTVTGPLLLGAALAGADDDRCAELERFGRVLGIAFQLRDDLLGTFGDPTATGKPVGNDIREGKRTALVAELGEAARPLLVRAAAGSDEDVTALVRELTASGARERVEARVRALCDEARRAVDAMAPTLTKASHGWLVGAIGALGDRTA